MLQEQQFSFEHCEEVTLPLPPVPGSKGSGDGAVKSATLAERELAEARASRSQAEIVRQRTANELLEATREVCEQLMLDAEQAVEKARCLAAEAEGVHQAALQELQAARESRTEAEVCRQEVLAKAQEAARELLDQAYADAQRQHVEVSGQASREAQGIIAQAEVMRLAAKEELEAQRLYTQAARPKAEAYVTLTQVQGKPGEIIDGLRNGDGSPLHVLDGASAGISLVLPSPLLAPAGPVPRKAATLTKPKRAKPHYTKSSRSRPKAGRRGVEGPHSPESPDGKASR